MGGEGHRQITDRKQNLKIVFLEDGWVGRLLETDACLKDFYPWSKNCFFR